MQLELDVSVLVSNIAGFQPHRPRCIAAGAAEKPEKIDRLVLTQVSGSNASTSAAYFKPQLDLDAMSLIEAYL